MTNYDDNNQFEGFEEEPLETTETEAPRSGGNNRSFLIVVGVIAAVFIFGIIGLGLVIFLSGGLGGKSTAMQSTASAIEYGNTATSIAATNSAAMTFVAMTPTITLTPTETIAPTETAVLALPTATETAIMVEQPTLDPSAGALSTPGVAGTPGAAGAPAVSDGTPMPPQMAVDINNRTATVAAFLTQAASGGQSLTLTPQTTSTKLPDTGFADEVGLPGLVGLAFALVAVIFIARRIRFSSRS